MFTKMLVLIVEIDRIPGISSNGNDEYGIRNF